MGNIYTYLKNAFQNLQKETSINPIFFGVLLVMWTIPLSYALNSLALILLVILACLGYKKSQFSLQVALLVPVALYVLMLLSFVWTADTAGTSRALSKGLPLLVLPLVYLFFPNSTARPKLLKAFAYGVLIYAFFCLLKAAFRFWFTHDSSVFFYHELVTEDVNAIHVSVYVSLAIFIFVSHYSSVKCAACYLLVLAVFLVLLSSKNILVITLVLASIQLLAKQVHRWNSKPFWIGLAGLVLVIGLFSGKITKRFQLEWEANANERSINNELSTATQNVYNVSVARAWNQAVFSPNDYFPGTAFRVYQIRIFLEMLHEDAIFFSGYGLNATDAKIAQKRIEHQLYPGYETKNFHNEYIQLFAELGIFGLLILLTLLVVNTRNAFRSKDFVHISFAVLLISLFLTESFLSRQRGIVFFTLMYCLFNTKIAANTSTEAKSNL